MNIWTVLGFTITFLTFQARPDALINLLCKRERLCIHRIKGFEKTKFSSGIDLVFDKKMFQAET